MHYSCMCGMHSAVVNLSNITDTVLLNKVTHYLAMSTGRSVYPLSSHSALLLSPPFLVSRSVPLSASLSLFLSLSFSLSFLSVLFVCSLSISPVSPSISFFSLPWSLPLTPSLSTPQLCLSVGLSLSARFLTFSFLSFFVSSFPLLLSLLMYRHIPKFVPGWANPLPPGSRVRP